MKKGLCLILVPLLTLGSFSFAEETKTGGIETILAGMSLRDKVAQMMIASFRTWQEVPEEDEAQPEATPAAQPEATPEPEPPREDITELNGPIREMLGRDHSETGWGKALWGKFYGQWLQLGALLVFDYQRFPPEQTLRLVSEMRTVNQSGGGLPQIFFADQEGGNVNRIGFGTQGVSNMALGATGDPENARIMASILGEEMRLLGIHADFAPVMDVNNNPDNPVIGIRSFSDDPQTVAAFGCAFLEGLHAQGVMTALKHFPGHGNTSTDSHTGFPLINLTYEELKACELIPFRAAIEAGVDMVMTAHIQYPQIEKETLTSVSTGEPVYLPATMSRTILTDILRGDLGFDGVIVTDALDMAAVADNFSTEDIIRYTMNAGVDMLIRPCVKDTNLFRLTETYVDTAEALVQRGEIDEARVDESVRRILRLKEKYGILEQTDFAVTKEQTAAAKEGVGSGAHLEAEWEIAEKALTLVKNENNAFPLRVGAGEKTLILFADSAASRLGAGDLAREMLAEERSLLPEGAEITVMLNTPENGEACVKAAAAADHVILVHRVYSMACLNPAKEAGFSSGVFDKVIDAVHQQGKTVIVIGCQLPYDAARFPEADAILLTYWDSAMREPPAKDDPLWSPNLPAGLLACFGVGRPGGELPVDIFRLGEDYYPTEEILWNRGAARNVADREAQ